jgi:hypothetical protein
MDYQQVYNNLMQTRKDLDRHRDVNVYLESHHIIPKCLGGTNLKTNLVLLTAREHYLAHWLLHRIDQNNTALSHAFWMMNFGSSSSKRVNKISSRMYAESKEAMSNANRFLNTGKKVKQEHLVAWHNNKNNSKKIVNKITGETFTNAKALWSTLYSDVITYTGFILYIKHPDRFKGSTRNRKLKDLSVLNWKYENNI